MAAIDSVRHELQLSPAIAVPSKFGSENASRSERVGSFGPLPVDAIGIAVGRCCSASQILVQRWRHGASATLEAEPLAQSDRGRRQRAERGDIDGLTIQRAPFDTFDAGRRARCQPAT